MENSINIKTLSNAELIEHFNKVIEQKEIQLSFDGSGELSGKKAIERYESRNQEFDNMIFNTSFQRKYNITKDDFNSIYNKTDEKKPYSIETEYKKKFHNTEKGIIMCNTYTVGFNNNIYCKICKNKDICKNITAI